MSQKRNVSRVRKDAIIWRDEWTCRICGEELLPMRWNCDHIVPLWEGGGNGDDNLQAICANCHAEKSCLEARRRREARRAAERETLRKEIEWRAEQIGATANIDLEIFRYDPNDT